MARRVRSELHTLLRRALLVPRVVAGCVWARHRAPAPVPGSRNHALPAVTQSTLDTWDTELWALDAVWLFGLEERLVFGHKLHRIRPRRAFDALGMSGPACVQAVHDGASRSVVLGDPVRVCERFKLRSAGTERTDGTASALALRAKDACARRELGAVLAVVLRVDLNVSLMSKFPTPHPTSSARPSGESLYTSPLDTGRSRRMGVWGAGMLIPANDGSIATISLARSSVKVGLWIRSMNAAGSIPAAIVEVAIDKPGTTCKSCRRRTAKLLLIEICLRNSEGVWQFSPAASHTPVISTDPGGARRVFSSDFMITAFCLMV
eukprot:1239072-Rhodomonas_salina.2